MDVRRGRGRNLPEAHRPFLLARLGAKGAGRDEGRGRGAAHARIAMDDQRVLPLPSLDEADDLRDMHLVRHHLALGGAPDIGEIELQVAFLVHPSGFPPARYS